MFLSINGGDRTTTHLKGLLWWLNRLIHTKYLAEFLGMVTTLLVFSRASLVAQRVKCLHAMWETQVRSLGREDLLEQELAAHSSILACKILWMEKPGRLQSMGSQRVGKPRFDLWGFRGGIRFCFYAYCKSQPHVLSNNSLFFSSFSWENRKWSVSQ